jgi:hypothetical protein
MDSWGGRKLLQFISGLRAGHLQGALAVSALLTCFAVVFSVGPFAKAPKREVVEGNLVAYRTDVRELSGRATEEATFVSTAVPQVQAVAGPQPERAAEPIAVNLAEQFGPSIEAASDAAVAPAAIEPVKDTAAEPQAAKPAHPDSATPPPGGRILASVLGVWMPGTGACSVRDFHEGVLLTIINSAGAWAGETFCAFKKEQETKTGWRVVADCSNRSEHWTTNVQLAVKNNRLTWTSKRGTQSYTRCARGFLIAAAH